MCTWNVKVTQPPDEDFRSFLHLDNEEQLPDIVAVGYGHLCVDFGAFIYINVTEMRYHVLSDCII